jgi:hypothetical protein
MNKHLKVSIEPGTHTLYVERAFGFPIRRKATHVFEKGKVHYMKVRYEYGLWVGSLWIEPTTAVASYESFQ